eukprot:TRINITY_DN1904_c0_g2_i5.p1 TRINITY_DN1904_c0_g2~~TRINITY_DN1904_c0_g2_i5.p1  ORF type:complete len:243 (+),score=3.49 TRINITY_DN1904_c0_g2_i5:699-1427(+)
MKKRIDAALAKDPWMLPREVVSKLRLPVDPKTVARYRSENYRKVKGVPRPVLSARNKQARLNWAKKHVNDSFDDVVFSDEKSFFLFKVTRSAWVKRGRDLPFRTQPAHPPRVQVLGGITRRGRTALRFFDGRLTGAKHRVNLEAILPSVRRVYRDDFRYLQDNDPGHTDRMSQQLLSTAVPHILRMYSLKRLPNGDCAASASIRCHPPLHSQPFRIFSTIHATDPEPVIVHGPYSGDAFLEF